MKYLFLTFLSIFLFTTYKSNAQKFYRIKSDFSIKAKAADGRSQLTVGTVYYDRNAKKLVYCNTFPKREDWVSIDTLVFQVVNNKVLSKYKSPPLGEFSIFNLALTSQINNYGLSNSMFKIEKVEKESGMVITTWIPPKKFATIFGKVLISNKNNRLNGIVFLDKDGKVIKKQFFDNWGNFDGLLK